MVRRLWRASFDNVQKITINKGGPQPNEAKRRAVVVPREPVGENLGGEGRSSGPRSPGAATMRMLARSASE